MTDRRFYEAQADGARRSAPAALRNREPIADVLADWLPAAGLVLEIASGTGEHVIHFAQRFPNLDWQPSDINPEALSSIAAWRATSGLANVRSPLVVDSVAADWPVAAADVILSLNLVHISPWSAALGLLDGAARILGPDGVLILYGPWLSDAVIPAPSNLAFDLDLRRRDPEWGLRRVEDLVATANERGLELFGTRAMPAKNLMMRLRRVSDYGPKAVWTPQGARLCRPRDTSRRCSLTDDERFFAWLDDELSDGEAEAMATRVAADPALSALAEDHRSLREKLGRAFSAIPQPPLCT